MRNVFDLSNRVAVVIGATSGIGRVIAIGLAENGADVVPTGRREELLESVCCEIEALGRRTLRHTADVTLRLSLDELRDAVLDRFGRIDILVNAAGHTSRLPTIEVGEEEWLSLIDTNLTGALRACQSFYGPLKASGNGRIINIASLGSYVAFYEVAAYCAAKTALLSLTRSMACEWANDRISVNAIAPGIFPTELNNEMVIDTPRGGELLARTPMGRFGSPNELVGAAVLLASDGASFLTGQCIAVDGGYLAAGVRSSVEHAGEGIGMRPEQWEIFKRAARLERMDKIPMALIIDSPWIPGYLGIKHLDYYLNPEVWFEANLKIMREFPDIIFVPSWWMEYGMAAEPSILGAKIKFWHNNTPSEYHTLYRLEDIDNFPEYEVDADAFAALTLHRIGMHKQRILDLGYILPMITSRGPLCTAGFVRGTTHFMIDLVEDPAGAHKLIDLCTRVTIDWLKAQHKVMGDTVESIFILDDIVGFINEEHYMEFAHPYLKRICDAFPQEWIKIYHNDAEVDACLDHLPDAGFNVLNWGKQKHITEVKQRVGDRMCLMGNVNPLEIGVRGTPDEVMEATLEVLEGAGGEGIILSVGGGTSPGMPRENIVAMLEALNEFNAKRAADPRFAGEVVHDG